jgi:tetratricopeptide (TPR) repeat protein
MNGLLVEDLRAELARGRVVVLVGAGVSIGATDEAPVASWAGLLEDGVARCEGLGWPLPAGWGDRTRAQIESGDVEELLLAAEAVTGRLGGRGHGEYGRWLKETVGELHASDLGVLEALRDLGGILATTNYDGLLERVTARPAVTWQDQARAQAVLRGDEQAIVHLHGFWKEPASVVLGVRSYEQLLGTEHAQMMQQAMAAMGTLLFVGFGAGLADPNFAALRAWMGRLFRGGQYRHFRLATDDEVATLQAEHDHGERVFVLGYGPTHADLAPFLRHLAPAPPPLAPGATSAPPRTRPRGPGGLPPVWNLPFASNPNFTGRTAILDGLLAGLAREPGMVHPQVIAGTGGVGKTQLAVEYAWRHRADYDAVWWVRAETTTSLHGDYAALAPKVGLGQDPDQDTMLAAVRDWLEDNLRWLVIFDNADDPTALIPLLPRAGDGHVLVTSQQEDDLGRRADLVPLDVLSVEEATQFLLTRTGHNDLAAARDLADALGYLPLALEQAGAFIAQTKIITLARYLDLFNQQNLKLLSKGGRQGSYRHTVDTTWDLSLQAVIRENLDRDTLQQWAAATTALLWASFPGDSGEVRTWPECQRLLPHVLAATGHAEQLGAHEAFEAISWLLDRAATYLQGRAQLTQAKALFERALAIAEAALGPDHPSVGSRRNSLGLVLLDVGDFTGAKAQFERALAIDEAALGPDHRDVGRDRGNLGFVLQHIVVRIRQIPGLEYFQLGPTLEEIRRAASPDPILYIWTSLFDTGLALMLPDGRLKGQLLKGFGGEVVSKIIKRWTDSLEPGSTAPDAERERALALVGKLLEQGLASVHLPAWSIG